MLVVEAEILDLLCYSVPHYWLFFLYIQVSITSDNDLLEDEVYVNLQWHPL